MEIVNTRIELKKVHEQLYLVIVYHSVYVTSHGLHGGSRDIAM